MQTSSPIQDQGSFTRGSQLYAHKLRMFGQGAKNSLIAGLIITIGWLLWRMKQKLTFASVYYFTIERYVQLKLAIGKYFSPISQIGIEFYYLEKKAFVYRSAQDFIYKFWHVTPYGVNISKFEYWCTTSALWELAMVFIIGVIAAAIFFMQAGRKVVGISKIRGGDLVATKILAARLRKAKAASKIVLSGLPLVKNSEMEHLLLTGTTGSGKTNLLNELLPQIRKQKDKAIILDLTGSFVDRFFNPEIDILLNPFEKNTVNWLPWNDCNNDYEFDALASAFIDGEGFSDKYWEEAAQKVLSEALQKEKKNRSLAKLLHILTQASLSDFCKYFAGTSAAGLVSIEGEKTTASIRSTLINKISRLKYLRDQGDFSIKSWVNNGQGWLFITVPPNQRDTLRPLVSAWIDIAIKGLMDRSPETANHHKNHKNNKMWFILDELPALQRIASLKRGLAEGRKYGGCFVAGIQNIFQMEEIYGHAGALSLLDMFNTRFFFKVGDQRTAEYASKNLGEKEISETRENLSYGADSMRDGVNINTNERTNSLVMPTEILSLPTRTCYVRLSGQYPITKLTMKLQKLSINSNKVITIVSNLIVMTRKVLGLR